MHFSGALVYFVNFKTKNVSFFFKRDLLIFILHVSVNVFSSCVLIYHMCSAHEGREVVTDSLELSYRWLLAAVRVLGIEAKFSVRAILSYHPSTKIYLFLLKVV